MSVGVLPSQAIARLVGDGAIASDAPIEPGQIQPASLDLRLGDRALRMRASFLPGTGRSVAECTDLAMHEMSLEGGAVLERGCVYLVPLAERLALPAELHAAANAKSSTGRLDLLTRLITDGGAEFDRIAPGYGGPLWAEICPRSFSVLVRPGMRLNQIRLRRGEARLDDTELADLPRTPTAGRGRGADRRRPGLLRRPGRVGGIPGRVAGQAPCGGDRPRPGGALPGARLLGALGAGARAADPRPGRLLHPGEPGGRAHPARLRCGDGALPRDGGRVPRALRGVLRPGLSATARRVAPARAACWRSAATRRPSPWSTGRSSGD